ncbi:Low density lipoprotein receptor adapter protein 1-A [Liparis tanakae]|uniref:Low density lipoprotein receptor adapter protein 1-A n=1 Tax=Liparis tanakae TaxID=230148 RepID=A0A4Z2FBQ0_9TELE|nr:Low density lipoprotein receptor adapter protein 1-A [Liparis tanakae]
MDALKSAGRAIVRSPSAAKQSWTSGRHRTPDGSAEVKGHSDYCVVLLKGPPAGQAPLVPHNATLTYDSYRALWGPIGHSRAAL